MEKKTVKCGLVGAGFASGFHYEAIRKVSETSAHCVGVYDVSAECALKFANKRDIKAFDSLESLIDASDVIHVCTPVWVHEEICIAGLEAGKHVICEKPLVGYCGDGTPEFSGDTFPKHVALEAAMTSIKRILDAEAASKGCVLYAENWVYAPAIQKEREIIEKTGAQILWMNGQQAHSGSHSPAYGEWKFSGGGTLLSKGCHPLTAAIYLKRVEGMARDGKPIHPATVTARAHAITRLPNFRDEGHIRTGYHDIDDFAMMHLTFTDGTIATVMASDIIMGGVHNCLEVAANNHRTICNLSPTDAMSSFNPVEANYDDIYVMEKLETKQGWSNPAPDEGHFQGHTQEIEDFFKTVAFGSEPIAGSGLAADAIAASYAAYVSAEQDGKAVAIPQVDK